MRMPRLAAPACAVLLAAGLSACTTPHACTAIGWSNQLRVQVTGNVGVVDRVTFCAGANCTPPAHPTPSPDQLETTTRDGDVWTLQLGMITPDAGHIGAFD
ncbi:hypothetical protein GCM10022287_23350 [Gryllotalpicola koreensis]|uniref:Uncharacterized protein n=2 Tax=Gryllotalpicola koreensis TaxID=993086 RepID=A0ABP8A2L2_9MICO